MDDHIYVQNNTAIRHLDLTLLSWAFTAQPIDFWQPLTWLSLAVDYHFWQLQPFGYHLTNIVLHAVNAALVVMILDRLPLPGMAEIRGNVCNKLLYPACLLLAGLLFGIHPLRVESVAWITERKDVLSGLFFLSSVFFYLLYARDHGRTKERRHFYAAAFLLFLLGLMVKPVGVVLPAVLLVLDWYPLERFVSQGKAQLCLEKLPFLLVSLGIAALTLYVGANNHILQPQSFLTLTQRLILSGNAIFEYLHLLLVPLGITPLYLIVMPLSSLWTVKAILVVFLSLFVYHQRRHRGLVTVWLCFLLPLLPVLALFQNGGQAFAARYTYLPAIAPSIAAALLFGKGWLYFTSQESQLLRLALVLTGCGIVVFYAVGTVRYIKVWDSGETYWSRVVAVQPVAANFLDRAELYDKKGKHAQAIADYTAALKTASGEQLRHNYNIYAFRGEAHRAMGHNTEAVQDLTTAINKSPHRIYFYCRGKALEGLGKMTEAAADFRIAGEEHTQIYYWYKDPDTDEIEQRLIANPNDAAALHERALAALRRRAYGQALEDITRAIDLQRENAAMHWSRSTIFYEIHQLDRALADASHVLKLDPNHADAYLLRASIFAEMDDYGKALAELDVLLQLDPASFGGHANRGLLLYRQGKITSAIKEFNTAIRINPDSAPVFFNRALAYAAAGNHELSEADFRKARELGYEP